MLSIIHTIALTGLEGSLVETQTDITPGFPSFSVIGLADTAVQEARERLRSAIKNSGVAFPSTKRILINLAPADVRKEGPGYDLPMAVGVFTSQNDIKRDVSKAIFFGELNLDGTLRHTNGALAVSQAASRHGFQELYLPAINAREAALVSGITIIPVNTLAQLFSHLTQDATIESQKRTELTSLTSTESAREEVDMASIQGQSFAKRALEIAASGGHNVLLSGLPGAGKTMLARAFAAILPPLVEKEIMEVTNIFSIAGLLPPDHIVITERPFRSPHHNASLVALVGGGQKLRPGEITLAHRGVLFLDEFPEFSRATLESLRQPLEDGYITIARAAGTVRFPARFTLIASQNPCPCGFWGDLEKACTCTPIQINTYQKKISGPLMDRIDLHVEVPRVPAHELVRISPEESSAAIRIRTQRARHIQSNRFTHKKLVCNADMGASELRDFCALDEPCTALMLQAMRTLHLSARAYTRVLKVARTIADLSESDAIAVSHLAEALQYRPKK